MAHTTLTEAQRGELRNALLEKRRELLSQLSRGTQAYRADGGEAELMDQAELSVEVDEGAQRSARESALLEEVDHALRKLADGDYGFSEDSGEAIAFERLRAVPWARRTASEEEDLQRQ